MEKSSDYQADLYALRNLISESVALTSTANLTNRRRKRLAELLAAAVALADRLIATPPAVLLGQRGGLKTAQRGSEYFRKIAAKRKTRAGGRQKKD